MAGSKERPYTNPHTGKVYSLHDDTIDFSYTPRGKMYQPIDASRIKVDFSECQKIHEKIHTNNRAEGCLARMIFLQFSSATKKECRQQQKRMIYSNMEDYIESGSVFYGFDVYGRNFGWKGVFEAVSLPDEPLDIPEEWVWICLDRAAKHIYKECQNRAGGIFGIFKFLLLVVAIVLTVVVGIFSGGSAIGIGISLIVTIVSYGVTEAVTTYMADAEKTKLAQKNEIDRQKENVDLGLKFAKSAERTQLTNSLIFNISGIMPNGAQYNQNQAGSQTYSPSIAYDPMKGLLGTIGESSTDEFTQNRSQVKLAGGKDYIQKMLGADFPLATFDLAQALLVENNKINAEIKHWMYRISFALERLGKLGWEVGGDGQYPSLKDVQKRLINTHIRSRINKICANDLSIKQKNYNKGLRYEMPLQVNEILKITKETKATLSANLGKLYENWASSLSKDISIDDKALKFTEFAESMLNLALDLQDSEDKKINGGGELFGLKNYKYFWVTQVIRHNDGKSTFDVQILPACVKKDDSTLYFSTNETPTQKVRLYMIFFGHSAPILKELTYGYHWSLADRYYTLTKQYQAQLEKAQNLSDELLEEFTPQSLKLEKKIEFCKRRISEEEANIQIYEQEIEILQNELQEAQTKLDELQKDKKANEQSIKEVKENIEQKEQEITDKNLQITNAQELMQNYAQKQETYKKINDDIIALMPKSEQLQNIIDSYSGGDYATKEQRLKDLTYIIDETQHEREEIRKELQSLKGDTDYQAEQ